MNVTETASVECFSPGTATWLALPDLEAPRSGRRRGAAADPSVLRTARAQGAVPLPAPFLDPPKLPTPSPTLSPVAAPTASPTTAQPSPFTPGPTSSVPTTSEPTRFPTTTPTPMPSPSSTASPTQTPTTPPSPSPTDIPDADQIADDGAHSPDPKPDPSADCSAAQRVGVGQRQRAPHGQFGRRRARRRPVADGDNGANGCVGPSVREATAMSQIHWRLQIKRRCSGPSM